MRHNLAPLYTPHEPPPATSYLLEVLAIGLKRYTSWQTVPKFPHLTMVHLISTRRQAKGFVLVPGSSKN
jgi:hypothetical protein